MTYDEFVQNDFAPSIHINLPSYFKNLIDRAMYSPAEIALVIGVHPETVRRWFRKGWLPHEAGVGRYKCSGLSVKRFIFSEICPSKEGRSA